MYICHWDVKEAHTIFVSVMSNSGVKNTNWYTQNITSSFVFFDISLVIQATESPHIDQAFTCDKKK